MTGPLDGVSSHWLATGRAMFKAPIAEELPGAFADLLFDPAERFAQVWALALDGSSQAPFEEAAVEPSGTSPVGRQTDIARGSRLTRAPQPSRRNIRTLAASGGDGKQPGWEFADLSESRVRADQSRPTTHEAHVSANDSPVSTAEPRAKASRHTTSAGSWSDRVATTTLPERLGSADKVGGVGQVERSDGSRPIRQMGAAQHRDVGRSGILRPADLGRQEEHAAPPGPRSEARTALRLAKSFSDIGRILGANLQSEDSGRSPAPEGARPAHRRPAAFPEPRGLSAKEPESVARPLHVEGLHESAAHEKPTADAETIFQELEQRLRLEYLRMYGTSGGF